jgi:chitin disaccharide deacetylase
MTTDVALLINADDYGLTEGITRGIACLLAADKISNATAMMCVPDLWQLK